MSRTALLAQGGYTAPMKTYNLAFTASASSATPVGIGAGPDVIWMIATTDCYIKFGGSTISAPSASDGWLLKAGVETPFEVGLNSSYFRVVRSASDGILNWYVAGQVSPAPTLTDLLRPYVVDIFDPSVSASVSLVSGNVQTITGLVAGNTLSAPGAGNRPALLSSPSAFAGNSYIQCLEAGNKTVSNAAVATPLLTGALPGLFYVGRVTGALTTGNRSLAVRSAGGNFTVQTGALDDNSATGMWTQIYNNPASQILINAAAPPATYSYLTQSIVRYDGSLRWAQYVNSAIANFEPATNLVTAATPENLETWILTSPSSLNVGKDIDYAYVAVLKSRIPPDDVAKIMAAAKTRFNLP